MKPMNADKITIGDAIRQAREAAGLTQEELGAKIGVTGVSIMRYEKGQRRVSYETAISIGDALGVSLFGMSETGRAEYAALEYRRAMAEHGARSAFYDLLDGAFGKSTKHTIADENGEDAFFVYENRGDAFALMDSDIDVMFSAAFAVIEKLADQYRMTEREAGEAMKQRRVALREAARAQCSDAFTPSDESSTGD